MIGMTLYIDLFANNIQGLIQKIDYFTSLGITMIHLMPLLKPRKGNSDGGYAVEDYRAINPQLGTLEDFKKLIQVLHDAEINVAIDFVINHTAKEHEWAKKAASGDVEYQNMYLMFDTEDIPNEYNRTVPEVLPDVYPGNFTYYESFKKYVFKSFSEFQWDLDFKNPIVLEEILDIFFFIANLGIDIIRLDAIPFIWKELGTSCRNLPEVHKFMHLFQLAKQYVSPGVAILGEAIVEPHEIVKYYGSNKKPECDLLYNASLMVDIWNTLATRDHRLLSMDYQRFVLPKHATWINYIRCHDDIGWGFNEDGLRVLGFDPFIHKQFLINFYNGSFEGSFSKGQNYQYNDKNLDARTNGTLASLAGLEKAMDQKNSKSINEAIQRIQMMNAFLLSMPGIPVIYSGDEIAQTNDYNHQKDPAKMDGRWLHRIPFPWHDIESYLKPESHSGKIYHHLKELILIRKNEVLFHNNAQEHIINVQNKHVFVLNKIDVSNELLCVYNFSEYRQSIDVIQLKAQGIFGEYYNLNSKDYIQMDSDNIILDPYDYLWLKKTS